MTYLPDLHTYLHQSSLLIQAYPTTRITTKYSLPRRPSNPTSKRSQKVASTATATTAPDSTTTPSKEAREKREPASTLTLKTYHAESGICLKYQTDKAQEVGRLLNGLGRLAKGEVIEMPTQAGTGGAAEEKMEVDEAVGTEGVVKDGKSDGVGVVKSAADMTAAQTPQGGSGGGKKKKKGKK